MLVSEIKSRPIYAGLKVDAAARRHLVAAEGEGALAVIDAFGADRAALDRTTLVYTPGGSAGEDHAARLAGLDPEIIHVMPSTETLLIRLNGLLTNAVMGTRLYAAGVEGFLGQVVQAGLAHGVDHHSIFTEHRGSLARRIQCVHCKGFTDGVTVSPVACAHCGEPLTVRDHYSRRLGAFQGVSAVAETPGEVPPSEELYK